MTTLRKAMPILLFCAALLVCLPLAAQTQDCSFTYTFTGDGTYTVSNLSNVTPCVNWRITLSVTGSLTTTATFYTSPDNSTFTAVPNTVCSATVQPPCILQGANPIVGTQGMIYAAAYGAFVRVVTSSSSGTGNGTIRGYGVKGASAAALPQGGSGGGGGGTVTNVATTSPITGGPITGSGTIGLDTTKVTQKFFGTGPPGSVAGNLPGDSFTDTTNHKEYVCNAPAGTAAPACTSVTAAEWLLVNGAGSFDCADASGSTTVYTCPTPSPVPTAYSTGALFSFNPQTTNTTTTPTLDAGALGPKNLVANTGSAASLTIGQLVGGTTYLFEYDGAALRLTSGAGGGGGGGTVTNTGSLTLNAVILGNNGVDVTPGAVLPGDATKFYDGTGNFSTPPTASAVPAASNLTPVTVSANTTGDQTLQEVALPAGALNTVLAANLIHGSGEFTIAALQTPTLTFKAKLCTVSGCGSGTVVTLASITSAASIAATNNGWNLQLMAGTSASGATGNLWVHGAPGLTVDIGALPGSAATPYTDTNTAVSSNIDLTAVLYVDFTVATSTGNAGNSITQDIAEVLPQGAGGGGGGGGSGGTPFVTAVNTCSTRNDYSDLVGMRFTLVTPVTVQSLGRYVLTGNTGLHGIFLYLFDGSNYSVLATALVDTSAGTPNTFLYSDLKAAVVLPVLSSSGAYYAVISAEVNGGDSWCDSTNSAQITTTGIATSIMSSIRGGGGSGGGVYVPTNFKYTP